MTPAKTKIVVVVSAIVIAVSVGGMVLMRRESARRDKYTPNPEAAAAWNIANGVLNSLGDTRAINAAEADYLDRMIGDTRGTVLAGTAVPGMSPGTLERLRIGTNEELNEFDLLAIRRYAIVIAASVLRAERVKGYTLEDGVRQRLLDRLLATFREDTKRVLSSCLASFGAEGANILRLPGFRERLTELRGHADEEIRLTVDFVIHRDFGEPLQYP